MLGSVTPSTAVDVVHHLYAARGDLLPYCGTVPGPDERTGNWNTGHERDELLLCLEYGMVCCSACLSPVALGGWTPLIMDEPQEHEDSGATEDERQTDD